MPLTLGLVITDMEYATRLYEVKKGQTDQMVKDIVEVLYEKLKKRPIVGKKLGNFLWHIFTDYFVDALKEVKKLWDEIEVDRLQPKAGVKITGEFWLQTHEGDGNYNIKRWLVDLLLQLQHQRDRLGSQVCQQISLDHRGHKALFLRMRYGPANLYARPEDRGILRHPLFQVWGVRRNKARRQCKNKGGDYSLLP
jgi:hypothetical protein